MHKKLLTLALGGVAIIGVLAGASYFSGGSLLSSVLPTTTTPTCQEQENDVSLAQDALKQFPERANITERVAVLQEAVNTAAGNVTKLEQVAFAAAKKLRYSDLNALMSDYKKYTELAQKMSAKNVEIKKSTAEVTRLSRLKPRTADVSAQIKKEQVKLSAIKEELSKINKERSVLNASIKKITRSTTTIDVLYNKYIKKAVSNISEAQKSLSEAQKSLELVLTEQKPIVDAETKLASAEKALEMCRAKTPETPKESVTYCFPIYQGADGDVQTNCVDDVSKIPQCYVKSTTTAIYDDETGELSSVNVVSDDNTKELFFCGDPETAYLDSANPTSGYPTMPGQGSNPGAEAAAPMGAENPNRPKKYPATDGNWNKYRWCYSAQETKESYIMPCMCKAFIGSGLFSPDGQPIPGWTLALAGYDCKSEIVLAVDWTEQNHWTWMCPFDATTESCSLDLPIMETYEECSSHDVNPECGSPFLEENRFGTNTSDQHTYCMKWSAFEIIKNGGKYTWKCGCPETATYVSCQSELTQCGNDFCDMLETPSSCPQDCKE